MQRASLVPAEGDKIATPGFADKDWMIATVPGTVLTSYLNDGAIPNPDFGDNQYAISDSFFCADFWYRDEFTTPARAASGATYLAQLRRHQLEGRGLPERPAESAELTADLREGDLT